MYTTLRTSRRGVNLVEVLKFFLNVRRRQSGETAWLTKMDTLYHSCLDFKLFFEALAASNLIKKLQALS